MGFIDRINKKDDSILLEYYDGENIKVNRNNVDLTKYDKSNDNIRIAFLDVESTGFDIENDEIIEIALKVIEINKIDGTDLQAVYKYESYNDPGFDIPDDIIALTGITNDIVKSKSINWDDVKTTLSACQLIVAHNAKFDRKFIEKYIETENVWACSQNDINWKNRGFFKKSLELLCIWHGFYYGAHRAMNDVNATIHLTLHPYYTNNKPLVELIENAKKPLYRIINKFPYNEDHIKLIKSRTINDKKYNWNASNKSWDIFINNELETNTEMQWLKDKIYNGRFRGLVELISPYDRYKENI